MQCPNLSLVKTCYMIHNASAWRLKYCLGMVMWFGLYPCQPLFHLCWVGLGKVMVLGVRRDWAVSGAEDETLNALCKGHPWLLSPPSSRLLELVMLLEWWSGTECTLFSDEATVKTFGKEHVIIILNHNFEIDFLCGWTMTERFGVLGVRGPWAFPPLQGDRSA